MYFVQNEGHAIEDARSNVTRKKRFTITKSRWPNRHNITYSLFTNTIPPYLDVDIVREEIRESFDVWQDAVAFDEDIVRFVYTYDHDESANVKVEFRRGAHGDSNNFDGRGGVVAHAFVPPDGRVHLDADELWLTRGQHRAGGTSLTATLVHEIGHALGLLHSSDANSVMFMWYNPKHDYLGRDDVNGLEQLYVSRNHDPLPSWVHATTSNSVDDVCEHAPSSVACIRGDYFVFRGNRYWRYADFEFEKLIESGTTVTGPWPETCRVIAASTLRDRIVLVDGRLWFEYNTTTLDSVRLRATVFNAIFEEDGVMYAVEDGERLYTVGDTIDRVGSVAEKFLGVRRVDWVTIGEDAVSAGVGRGRWTFTTVKTRADVGRVYRTMGSIEPLMRRC